MEPVKGRNRKSICNRSCRSEYQTRTQTTDNTRLRLRADKADYKTMQMRILAHLSQDRALMEACAQEEDIHQRTADRLGINRNLAKVVNFGICFGITKFGLADNLNRERLANEPPVNDGTAQKYIDEFFALYPTAKAYFEKEWKRFLKDGEKIGRFPSSDECAD